MGALLRIAPVAGIAIAVAIALPVPSDSQSPSPARIVGTVKSVTGNAVTLTTDSGPEMVVTFADSARIVRAAPGQADLKSAPAITVGAIEVGDRILARVQSGEGNAAIASSAIVMKKGDIASRQQQEQEEWRRGVGGIVRAADLASGSITIVNALAASGKEIVIHVSPDTKLLRYAPDSVKFDDAKPGTMDQIKPGDQLRARGAKSADGAEFAAQAVVSGTFRDIAGTVVSTEPASNTVTVMDLISKKPVTIRLSRESQLRKLPEMMAMGIAMRLKGSGPGSPAAAGSEPVSGSSGSRPRNGAGPAGGATEGKGDGNMRGAGHWRGNGNGHPDFQQILSRMPGFSLADLHKGDAVMLVATEGTDSSGPTAITMLAGVEPILSAAPAGTSASTILSPWNLGAGGGQGEDAATQ